MGTVNVTQVGYLARDNNGHYIQIAEGNAVSSENVTSSGTSAQSAAFAVNCQIVRISSDTTVRILFGANPTATSASMRLPADVVEYFGVTPGQKVAVIDE